VDAPSGFARCLGHGLRERHDVVPSLLLDLVDSIRCDNPRIRDIGYLVVVFSTDSPELAVCPDEGPFDLEMTRVPTFSGPDVLGLIATVSIVQRRY
jgi:hypothetical protein